MLFRTGFADGESACKCGAEFTLSPEAKAVLDAGRELWRYYHKQPKANPNASYYDIRKFFQGVKVDAKGKEKMNSTGALGGRTPVNTSRVAISRTQAGRNAIVA